MASLTCSFLLTGDIELARTDANEVVSNPASQGGYDLQMQP